MTDCMLFQVLSLSCIIWEYPKPIYFNFGKHHWSKTYRNAPPIFARTHTHTHTLFLRIHQCVKSSTVNRLCWSSRICKVVRLAMRLPTELACCTFHNGVQESPFPKVIPTSPDSVQVCICIYTYYSIYVRMCREVHTHTYSFFLCLNRWPGADLETHTMFMVYKSQILVNLDSRQPNTDLRQPFPYIRTTVSTTSWWGPRTVCYFQKKSHPSLHTSA